MKKYVFGTLAVIPFLAFLAIVYHNWPVFTTPEAKMMAVLTVCMLILIYAVVFIAIISVYLLLFVKREAKRQKEEELVE